MGKACAAEGMDAATGATPRGPTGTSDSAPPPQRRPSPPDPGLASLGERVADAVVQTFRGLPRTAKPQPHEHTVLAGFVASEAEVDDEAGAPSGPAPLRVLALATGTKCLPRSARDGGGLCLNDCHAEVLARRALLLYLHAEARELLRRGAAAEPASDVELGPLTLLTLRRCGACGGQTAAVDSPAAANRPGPSARAAPQGSGWELALRAGVRLHMFASAPPCGDACVVHGAGGGDAAPATAKFTGAKLLDTAADRGAGGERAERGEALDPGRSPPVALKDEPWAAGPQAVGCLRRKPGRGESTLSMSCSDKLARWRLLGVQGGLWAGLLHGARLRLASVTACNVPGTNADAPGANAAAAAALTRALVSRFDGVLEAAGAGGSEPGTAEHMPAGASTAEGLAPPVVELLPSLPEELAETLGLAPSAGRRSACGSSLLWHAGVPGSAAGPYSEGLTGVLGLRAGHRRKVSEPPSPKAASAACRARLGVAAAELWHLLRRPSEGPGGAGLSEGPGGAAPAGPDSENYDGLKAALAGAYAADWRRLRAMEQFQAWIPKPPATFPLDQGLGPPPQATGCKRRREAHGPAGAR